jgi:hypothetical protein
MGGQAAAQRKQGSLNAPLLASAGPATSEGPADARVGSFSDARGTKDLFEDTARAEAGIETEAPSSDILELAQSAAAASAPPDSLNALQAASIPGKSFSVSSWVPIKPVEHTKTS